MCMQIITALLFAMKNWYKPIILPKKALAIGLFFCGRVVVHFKFTKYFVHGLLKMSQNANQSTQWLIVKTNKSR